jgi:hypothetical protein
MGIKRAVVAILQKLVSSPKHISGVQLVIQQNPSKEFDFGNTFGFPYPGDSLFRVNHSERILIKLARSIAGATPDERP